MKGTDTAGDQPCRRARRRKEGERTPKQSAAELRSGRGNSTPRRDSEPNRPEPEKRSFRPLNMNIRRNREAARPKRNRGGRGTNSPTPPKERGGVPVRRPTECRRSAGEAKPRGKIVFYCSSNRPCLNFIGRARFVNAAGRRKMIRRRRHIFDAAANLRTNRRLKRAGRTRRKIRHLAPVGAKCRPEDSPAVRRTHSETFSPPLIEPSAPQTP